MILRRDGVSRRDYTAVLPNSVPEIGRLLRRERTRQGLSTENVSFFTGIPSIMIEALESGTVDHIPNQVSTLKALERYAKSLGLPSAQYVLALVEHWPDTPADPVVDSTPAPLITQVHRPSALSETASISKVSNSEISSEPLTSRATTRPSSLAEPHWNSSHMVDTGVIPSVSKPPEIKSAKPRKPKAPLLLRLLFALVALAFLSAATALVVDKVHPQWLHDIGVLHSPGQHGGSGNTPATKPASPPPIFSIAHSGSSTADFNVRATSFDVRVVTLGYPSWVQASNSSQATPFFSKIIGAGQSHSFTVTHQLTLQVGSASAKVFVSVSGKDVGFYFPPSAPFTMNFTSIR